MVPPPPPTTSRAPLLLYTAKTTPTNRSSNNTDSGSLDELLLRVDHVEQPLGVDLLARREDHHLEQLRDSLQKRVQVRSLTYVHLRGRGRRYNKRQGREGRMLWYITRSDYKPE